MAADGSAHQPRQPGGDGGEMSPDAESPQPGESAAQDDEDLPEVNIQLRTCTVICLNYPLVKTGAGGSGQKQRENRRVCLIWINCLLCLHDVCQP